MANETTYSLISSLVNPIWEAALMYAQQNFFMPSIVSAFNDFSGMQDRKVTEYAAGTVITSLAETTDLVAQALSRALTSTLTPAEVGTMYFLTDRRRDSDPEDTAADIAEKVGYEIFLQIEKDLLGDMASFTGGTVGFAGSALNWGRVYAARAKLAASAIPGPYVCVLHEYQYYQLATAANIVGVANAAPLKVRDDIQSRYYVGSTSDIDFYTTGVLTAGTAVKGGIFNRQALAYDLRRGFRIEPQRDASMRGAELNATVIYAHGLWRPTWGVTILADATAPNP
jgi:hypothetical protein